MVFRTIVDIPDPGFSIGPCEEMLFVGSCFADSIGARFREEGFPVTVNPFGTMYNPASILHTIEKLFTVYSLQFTDDNSDGSEGLASKSTVNCKPSTVNYKTVFLTLGTNHVYRLKETGEIVDNCEKRPQSLFNEEELTVDACADYLQKAMAILRQKNPEVRIVLTVSPIRYRKYGYHGSQLSKATLLLAIEKLFTVDYYDGLEGLARRTPRLPILCLRHAPSLTAGCRLYLGAFGRNLFLSRSQSFPRRMAPSETSPRSQTIQS